MPKPSKVHPLSTADAAYVAGLIDGEGSISLTRRHSNEQRQLVVSISNTELPLLEYTHKAIGAGKITGKRTYKNHHATGYTYSIANRQALALLAQVQPYLRSYKSKRSGLVLHNYLRLTPRNGKYTPQLLAERALFENEFLRTTAGLDI